MKKKIIQGYPAMCDYTERDALLVQPKEEINKKTSVKSCTYLLCFLTVCTMAVAVIMVILIVTKGGTNLAYKVSVTVNLSKELLVSLYYDFDSMGSYQEFTSQGFTFTNHTNSDSTKKCGYSCAVIMVNWTIAFNETMSTFGGMTFANVSADEDITVSGRSNYYDISVIIRQNAADNSSKVKACCSPSSSEQKLCVRIKPNLQKNLECPDRNKDTSTYKLGKLLIEYCAAIVLLFFILIFVLGMMIYRFKMRKIEQTGRISDSSNTTVQADQPHGAPQPPISHHSRRPTPKQIGSLIGDNQPVQNGSVNDTGELTPHVLNKEIHHLVGKWEVFVQHLPWPGDSSTEAQTQIGIAKKNNPNDVQVQKEAVISNWLSMYPQASWANVVRALQEAEEHTLAKRIQAKYRVELPTRPPVQ